jgi:hypothetical protein
MAKVESAASAVLQALLGWLLSMLQAAAAVLLLLSLQAVEAAPVA